MPFVSSRWKLCSRASAPTLTTALKVSSKFKAVTRAPHTLSRVTSVPLCRACDAISLCFVR